jgi:hypothetical protein
MPLVAYQDQGAIVTSAAQRLGGSQARQRGAYDRDPVNGLGHVTL